MTPPRLSVVGATVRFGDRIAVDTVDLDVAEGEVVAVLGPSGSGKSTLLRAIAGLQPLDSGSVLVDGRDLATVPVHRRGVGLMFQDHALFPHRDVAGNVAFGLRMQRLDRAVVRARVAELLSVVGLPRAEDRRIAELSGGEQQRVALARALAPSPSVLLLDEPLGALDRTLRDHLVEELRRLFTEHRLTVVAVTHDQAEAFALADRIVVVDAGHVLQSGPPIEVWRGPRTGRVAELLGLTNVIEGPVRAGRVLTAWGELPVPGVPGGRVSVVVRPDGVRVDPEGPVEAVVRDVTFRGPVTAVVLVPDDGPEVRAELPSGQAPDRGARVRLRIDPDAVVPLEG